MIRPTAIEELPPAIRLLSDFSVNFSVPGNLLVKPPV
jgi:hypothetical protein